MRQYKLLRCCRVCICGQGIKLSITMNDKGKIISRKLGELKKILFNMESVLIAYSGGVDSTLLLKVAKDALGDKVLAVIAESEVYPSDEITQAEKLARSLKVNYRIIKTQELDNPKFADNPRDRCYWCKNELFAELISIARQNNLKHVLDGTNFDDLDDFRPGMKAADGLGIRSPLKEAMFTKGDIRFLSKQLNLSTWNKPSFACLASRFPYGSKITKEALLRVGYAEAFLKGFGITQVRVRQYNQTARIEVLKKEIPKLLKESTRKKIVDKFKELGYIYITVDLEG
ncbi:MAG: ATP-dependent sacrificial sulfur transferase LarE, partial [Candidatus Omnitrophota bacterium]